ncbi:hypothetical protein GCM10010269_33880 [Streptomyces humidus]|uniref:Alpha/beta hydrolase n=1 Tax=Streptomyces humidus TaxID=52259 RepID=A0A918L3E9_9ACTN|nr:hypothetical protein [Streptomyces humidus]GGR91935.1 hypothetical protein GCM10010269_33880 [Streptomyces humidus]
MADVVVVHGIFANRSSRDEMRDTWLAALREGLENVRYREADSLTIECVFYGHLYNDGKAGPSWQYEVGDLEPGLERELLIAFAESIDDPARDDPARDEAGKAGYAPRSVQWAIDFLQARKVLGGTNARILGFVKQVARYLRDPEFKKKVQAEFSAAMESGPRVVVAHSLGSVVAYDWLRSHGPTSAKTLVTLGSPLGLRPVLRELHPYLDACPAPWPPGIDTWVNVAAKEDAVATVKKLNGLFAGEIRDLTAANSRGTAHDALVYLKNVRTAESVKVALG